MQKIATGDSIHGGHRERMRSKFKIHGARVFDTYELLEMLLYSVVRYKDTNPIAKNLLLKFSSVDGIMSATREELLSTDGVGERVADFILGISRSFREIDFDDPLYFGEQVLTHEKAGELFIRYFSSFKTREEREKKRVIMALFDNNMHLISLVEVYNIDFESGGIKGGPFVDAAISANASLAILAHNHPYGPPCATISDIETNKMVHDALISADVELLEHFIICGNEFTSFYKIEGTRYHLEQSPVALKFIKDSAAHTGLMALELCREEKTNEEKIVNLVSLASREEGEIESIRAFSKIFTRLYDVFSSDYYVLSDFVSEKTAVFLKLFHALAVRRLSDKFSFGYTHTDEEISEYLTAAIGTEPRECTYLLLFDEKRRAICCEFVSEGTVNSSSLPPRKLLEIAKRVGARGAVLCHNHPGGITVPSDCDLKATLQVDALFRSVGITLFSHYIVSGREYRKIDLADGRLVIDGENRKCTGIYK